MENKSCVTCRFSKATIDDRYCIKLGITVEHFFYCLYWEEFYNTPTPFSVDSDGQLIVTGCNVVENQWICNWLNGLWREHNEEQAIRQDT